MAEYNFPYIFNPSLITTKIPKEMLDDLLGFAKSDDAKSNPVDNMKNTFWFPFLESVDNTLTDMYTNWRQYFDFEDFETEFRVYTSYMYQGDHIMTHSYNDCFASFILWLQIPEQGEKLTFTYPLLGGQLYHNVIDVTKEGYTGTMIMFPGYLNYSVYPKIADNEERIVVTGHVCRQERRDTII